MESSVKEKYEVVIGLEIHAQLLTESKAYSSDSVAYGAMPNTQVGAITLAHPGTLPFPNKKVVEYAVKAGLACGAEITRYNIYDRKNYFYPDLPKGYQITQDKTPICRNGHLTITLKDGAEKRVGITRIHMEEDAGKSLHLAEETDTLVDFNRAGVPLIEIVSEPELRSGEEAYAYLTQVRKLLRYLDICDGNMEEGSLRCDANISVRLRGEEKFGKRVEVKNMNSIRNVQRAIEHEAERQIAEIEAGREVVSETRNFDALSGTTMSMRTKESLNDYRYFPDPDLPPVIVSEAWLSQIKSSMPALPQELYKKFTSVYALPDYDAGVLTETKEIALYFEEICRYTSNYKAASNWVMGPVKSYLNELTLHIDHFPVSAEALAQLIQLIDAGTVSYSSASQQIFPKMIEEPSRSPLEWAQLLNLIQESNSDLLKEVITEVVSLYPDKVAEYRSGKKGLLGMFMGEVMKKTRGKADPKLASKLLEEVLE